MLALGALHVITTAVLLDADLTLRTLEHNKHKTYSPQCDGCSII